MKKVRSSQASISISSCTELSNTTFHRKDGSKILVPIPVSPDKFQTIALITLDNREQDYTKTRTWSFIEIFLRYL